MAIEVDLEIAEVLPAREELGFFTKASNTNFQFGYINQNNQANVVNSAYVVVAQGNFIFH
jgi:hypothetical protein